MKCYNPTNVYGSQYPCGYCYACKLNYSSLWGQRLMNEAKFHEKKIFVTLTYDAKKLPFGQCDVCKDYYGYPVLHDGKQICKVDAQKFLKRLRKKRKVRYYLTGEYGDKTHRPHYHAILFGVNSEDEKTVHQTWGKGYVYVGDVTTDSCNYVTGYITKKLKGDERKEYIKSGKGQNEVEPFGMMSRKPGIGAEFCDRYGKDIVARGFAYVKANKSPIPRYYIERVKTKDDEAKGLREGSMYVFKKRNRIEKMNEIKQIGYEKFYKKELDKLEGACNNVHGRLKMKERKI